MKLYNQQHIQKFYNEYADLETQRWDKSLVEQVKLFVHQHYLKTYIQTGDHVLELGAGTGIFTEQLAGYTDKLVVTDLSPVQLQLNQERAKREDYTNRIQAFQIVDICDLSAFEDNSFDKIVCYGGPLSYVFNQKEVALKEMRRVLKPSGLAFLGVMNLWGTLHEYLHKIVLAIEPVDNEKIIKTGNLHPSSFTSSDHHCHLFTADELKQVVQDTGFEMVVLSASNCLSALRQDELGNLQKDEKKWTYFLDLEIRACQSSGMVESGTHLIAVIQKG